LVDSIDGTNLAPRLGEEASNFGGHGRWPREVDRVTRAHKAAPTDAIRERIRELPAK
jgi:hypothetical protein